VRDTAFDDGTPEDRPSDRDDTDTDTDTDDGDGGRVRPAVHVALVHHPVLDRQGEIITTAVTNLDIHDIARSARSYGFAGYWVVTPIEAQRTLVGRVLEHWRTGAGARRIPERSEALRLVRVVPSLEAAVAGVAEEAGGRRPRLVATAAAPRPPGEGPPVVTFQEERARLSVRVPRSARPTLLLFGTGHGLAGKVFDQSDALLPPIQGGADFNHLSVRAAAAIVFDRLLANPC